MNKLTISLVSAVSLLLGLGVGYLAFSTPVEAPEFPKTVEVYNWSGAEEALTVEIPEENWNTCPGSGLCIVDPNTNHLYVQIEDGRFVAEGTDAISDEAAQEEVDRIAQEHYAFFAEGREDVLYKNEHLGFQVTIFSSWKPVQEKAEYNLDGLITDRIRIYSENDEARYMEFSIVKKENANDPLIVDAPMRLIGSDDVNNFYLSAGGDYAGMPGVEDQKYFDIANEVDQMIDGFFLTLN